MVVFYKIYSILGKLHCIIMVVVRLDLWAHWQIVWERFGRHITVERLLS